VSGEPDLLPRAGEVYMFSFRVRKMFFDRVLKGFKDYELRRATPFWDVRFMRAQKHLSQGGTVKAVLVCGNRMLVKTVKAVTFYAGDRMVELDPNEALTVAPLDGGVWKIWRAQYDDVK